MKQACARHVRKIAGGETGGSELWVLCPGLGTALPWLGSWLSGTHCLGSSSISPPSPAWYSESQFLLMLLVSCSASEKLASFSVLGFPEVESEARKSQRESTPWWCCSKGPLEGMALFLGDWRRDSCRTGNYYAGRIFGR